MKKIVAAVVIATVLGGPLAIATVAEAGRQVEGRFELNEVKSDNPIVYPGPNNAGGNLVFNVYATGLRNTDRTGLEFECLSDSGKRVYWGQRSLATGNVLTSDATVSFYNSFPAPQWDGTPATCEFNLIYQTWNRKSLYSENIYLAGPIDVRIGEVR